MIPIRSLLMVPAHKPRCLAKAFRLGADAVVFDLEDSVPADKKPAALAQLLAFLAEGPALPVPTFVRINPAWAGRDWHQVQRVAPALGVMVPKVRGVPDVTAIAAERDPVLLVVETPAAILLLPGLLGLPNVLGAVFGIGDFAAAMGVADRPFGGLGVNQRFGYAKQKLAVTAHALGKLALDTSFHVKGPDAAAATAATWEESAAMGFTGASPIHPDQVALANRIFTPSGEQRMWAQLVREGSCIREGEVWVDPAGCVVGPPHDKQATAILDARR